LAEVLRISPQKIDSKESINDLGIDSLMTIELSSKIQVKTGVLISSAELLERPSIDQLARKVLKTLISEDKDILKEIEEMTEEEIDERIKQNA